MSEYGEDDFDILGEELPGDGYTPTANRDSKWYRTFAKVASGVPQGTWVSVWKGSKTLARVYRSNFKGGRMNVPKGHLWDVAVITYKEDPSLEDHIGRFCVRYNGPDPESERPDPLPAPRLHQEPEEDDPFYLALEPEGFAAYFSFHLKAQTHSIDYCFEEIDRYLKRHPDKEEVDWTELIPELLTDFDPEDPRYDDDNIFKIREGDISAVSSESVTYDKGETGLEMAHVPAEPDSEEEAPAPSEDLEAGGEVPEEGHQSEPGVPSDEGGVSAGEGPTQAPEAADQEDRGEEAVPSGPDEVLIGREVRPEPGSDHPGIETEGEGVVECEGAPIGSDRKHDFWTPLQGAPPVCRWCDQEQENTAEVQTLVQPDPQPMVAQPEGRSIQEIIQAQRQNEAPKATEPIPGLEDLMG